MARALPTALMLLVIATSALPARGEDVLLVTGETLRARVLSRDEQSVVVDHPVLGRLVIPLAQVKSISTTTSVPADATTPKPAPGASAGSSAKPATTPAATQTTRAGGAASTGSPAAEQADAFTLLPTPPVPAWWTPRKNQPKFRADLGISGAQGDTDSVALNAGLKASRRTNLERWKAVGAYYLTESNGARTRDEAFADANYDLFFPPHDFFPYMQGRLDYNEFGEWRTRAAGFAGVGWEAIDRRKIELVFRAGAGGRKQFASDDRDFRPEATLGAEFTWIISDRQRLAASSSFIPEIANLDVNRVISSAEWLLKLDEAGTVNLKLGIQDEYKSTTSDDSKTNNTKFITAIVVEF